MGGCWQLKNLRKRRRTEEEERKNEEVKKQKKMDFFLWEEKEEEAAELRQKQTNASRFGRVSGTHTIHSFDRFSNPWEVLEREFSSISENTCSHLAEEVREKERD